MHRTPQQPISPIRKQIPNIHQHRRRRVVFCPRRYHGHGRPCLPVTQQDLQPGLAAQTKQQRQRTVVGVGACADVFCLRFAGSSTLTGSGSGGERSARGIAKKPEDGAGGTLGTEVGGGEEGWRGDLEAGAEEGGQFEGEVVAEVAEGADAGLVGEDGWGEGLLGFVGEEFAEVEGSGSFY